MTKPSISRRTMLKALGAVAAGMPFLERTSVSPAAAQQPGEKANTGFWLSGGSRNLNSLDGVKEWGKFRGRPVTLVTTYSTRDAGWSAFVSTHAFSGQPAHYTDKSLTLILQTSPFPTNVSATYAELVAGAYDIHWQRIGALLKERQDRGFPPVILSPAWEMNGTYMSWGGGTGTGKYRSPKQYVEAFRRIVDQVRVTYPGVKVAWTINGHGTPPATGTKDAFDFYPGNAHVDYLGIDDYDHYPPARTRSAFDSRAAANGGIQWLARHARENGKKLLVPEWGVAPGSGSNGGGDNPDYIQWMFEAFRGWHAEGLLAGEVYFADRIGGGNVDSDLIGGNPLASARYVSLWRDNARASE